MIGSPPGLDPFFVVLEIIIVSIIDIFHRCIETGPIDVGILEQRGDNLKGQSHVQNATVNVTVDYLHLNYRILLFCPDWNGLASSSKSPLPIIKRRISWPLAGVKNLKLSELTSP
jgi:hypothetical protein